MTTDFLIQGYEDALNDSPNAQPEKQPDRVRMVTDTKYNKVKLELKEAREMVAKLNKENNALTMRVRQLEMAAGKQGRRWEE